MVGPPVAGAMYDYTGDYNVSFYAAGGLLLLSSLISFLVPVARRCLGLSLPPGGEMASPEQPSSPCHLPEVIVSPDDDGSPVHAV